MPFWTRSLPDGKKAAGFGVYISGLIIVVGAIGYIVWGGKKGRGLIIEGPPTASTSASRVAGIGAAVARVDKVEKPKDSDQAEGLSAAHRVETPSTPVATPPVETATEGDGSSSLFSSLVRIADEEAKMLTAGASETGPAPVPYTVADGPPLPRVPVGQRSGGEKNQRGQQQGDDMFVYRRPVAKFEAEQPVSRPAPTGFETGEFLPRGFEIEAYLLTRVETTSQETVVTLGVAKNVVYRGRMMLPMGTRLLGSSSGEAVRDRISIRVDTVLFPNGQELPLNAVVRDTDKMTGVRSYYIPPPTWVQMAPYVNDFLSAYLALVAQNQQRGIQLQIGDVKVQPQVQTFDAKTEAISATSKAIQTFSERQMNELSRRYAANNVVPPGTRCYVVLQGATDFSQRSVNGASRNTMPVLPGYENNSIGPNGLPARTLLSERSQGTLSAAMMNPGSKQVAAAAPNPTEPAPIAPGPAKSPSPAELLRQ